MAAGRRLPLPALLLPLACAALAPRGLTGRSGARAALGAGAAAARVPSAPALCLRREAARLPAAPRRRAVPRPGAALVLRQVHAELPGVQLRRLPRQRQQFPQLRRLREELLDHQE